MGPSWSRTFTPGYARGQLVDHETLRQQIAHPLGEDPDSKVSPEQKETEVRDWMAYEKCLEHMFATYIFHCYMFLGPEITNDIRKVNTCISLRIIPIIRLTPVKNELTIDDVDELRASGKSLFKAVDIMFEIPQGNESFKLLKRRRPDDLGVDKSDCADKRVFLCPISIRTSLVISDSPLPIMIKVSDVLFDRSEINSRMEATIQDEIASNLWSQENPLSRGNIRYTNSRSHPKDKPINRDVCGIFNQNGRADGATITTTSNDNITQDGDADMSTSFLADQLGLSDKKVLRLTSQSFFTRDCARGDYGVQLQRYQTRQSAVGGEQHKDFLIKVQPPASAHNDQSDNGIIYDLKMSEKRIMKYCGLKKENIVQDRLVRHLIDSDDMIVDGIHTLVDPSVSEYNGKNVHLQALRKLTSFMREHEFYFESDFIVRRCYGEKRSGNSESNKGGSNQTNDLMYVGTYDADSVKLRLHGRGSIDITTASSAAAETTAEKRSRAKTKTTGSKTKTICAVPKHKCDSVRNEVEELYSGMSFIDLSRPKIEVDVEPTTLCTYLSTIEEVINDNMYQYLVENSIICNKKEIFLSDKEEALSPILVLLDMECYEIREFL